MYPNIEKIGPVVVPSLPQRLCNKRAVTNLAARPKSEAGPDLTLGTSCLSAGTVHAASHWRVWGTSDTPRDQKIGGGNASVVFLHLVPGAILPRLGCIPLSYSTGRS